MFTELSFEDIIIKLLPAETIPFPIYFFIAYVSVLLYYLIHYPHKRRKLRVGENVVLVVNHDSSCDHVSTVLGILRIL